MARTSRIQKGISVTNDRQHGSSYILHTWTKQIFFNIVRNTSDTCVCELWKQKGGRQSRTLEQSPKTKRVVSSTQNVSLDATTAPTIFSIRNAFYYLYSPYVPNDKRCFVYR